MNLYNPSHELMLSKDKSVAKREINHVLKKSEDLKKKPTLLLMQYSMLEWCQLLVATLDKCFCNTQRYQYYREFISGIALEDNSMKTSPLSSNSLCSSPSFNMSEEQALAQLKRNVDEIVDSVEEMKSVVDLNENIKTEIVPNTVQVVNPQNKIQTVNRLNEKIFIVHGHNEAMIQATARFIEKLNLKAVILSEQVNQGNTLIEKFEDNSEVGYAVILCSQDDIGYAKNNPEQAKPRARQNVVFELGYFFAKLGRDKVAVLVENVSNFEKPSDISGIVYIPYDNDGAWRYKLVKELKAQGYAVSADSL